MALVYFIAISIVWFFIAPLYNRMILSVANVFVPEAIFLTLDENTIRIFIRNIPDPVGGIYVSSLHYGLIVVASLVLATPALKVTRRAVSFVIALVAIFAVHVTAVALFAGTVLSGDGGLMERNPLIVLMAVIGADLFPILIWVIVSSGFLSFGDNGKATGHRRDRTLKPAGT